MNKELIIVRGAGDLASGIIWYLKKALLFNVPNLSVILLALFIYLILLGRSCSSMPLNPK